MTDAQLDRLKTTCFIIALLLAGIAGNLFAAVKHARADDDPRAFYWSQGASAQQNGRRANSDRRRAPDPAIAAMVTAAAFVAGVPANIAHAVIRHESGYRPHALGDRGRSYGLGQVQCRTARGMGFTGPCSQLYDPATNLIYTMRYLRQALDKGGSGCSGITLYNTGTGRRAHCSRYGRQVQARM